MVLDVYGQPDSASSGRVDRSVKRFLFKLYSILARPYNPRFADKVDKLTEYRQFVYFFTECRDISSLFRSAK